ncbi:hypothetical protein GCM10010399_58030 [Dactylosporangium fulvum]
MHAERDRLDIKQPPLAVITARASVLRRRRRLARAGAASAVAALAILAVTVTVTGDDRPVPNQPAASDPAGVWSAEDITVNGLPHLPTDLPGTVRDVEFLDPERGFLLSVECKGASCTTWVSATADGGRTWRTQAAPGALGSAAADALPTLVVTGPQITLLGAGTSPLRSTSADGETWNSRRETLPAGDGTAPLPGTAHLFQAGLEAGFEPASKTCGKRVLAVTPEGIVAPPRQPTDIEVCWTAPVRGGDGSWWVGGRSGGSPALAVSRDDGATWEPHVFTGSFTGSSQARMVMHGRNVFAVIVDPSTSPESLLGVASSDNDGATFGPVHPTVGQATIGGDPVPLLDGRLLIVDGQGNWLVSENRGATWHRVTGLHHTLRLARTQAGYVAYNMSTIYTAYSVDGSTWQKLDAQ